MFERQTVLNEKKRKLKDSTVTTDENTTNDIKKRKETVDAEIAKGMKPVLYEKSNGLGFVSEP